MTEIKTEETPQVNIKILGKTFQIRCPSDKTDELHNAAERIEKEMQKMRRGGVVGMERLAVITALNFSRIVNELETSGNSTMNDAGARITKLQKRIDEVLTQAEQLEL